MAKQIKKMKPPVGVAKFFFRLPIFFYKINLGWLLGKKFLLLNHVGRKSGLPRKVVLEVVNYNVDTQTYIVNAGFGSKSQWYKNLLSNPEASIKVGRKKMTVITSQLSSEEGGAMFQRFAKENPREARFAGILGFETDGTSEDYFDMGTQMIFMALAVR